MDTADLQRQLEEETTLRIKAAARVARLEADIERLTKAGNRMSIRTGQFGCSKHYQDELRAWAEVVTSLEKE